MTSRGRALLRVLATVLLVAGIALALAAGSVDERPAESAGAIARVDTSLVSARRLPAFVEQLAGAQVLQRDLADRLGAFELCAAVDAPIGAVARIDPDRALTPASTLKLVTGAAALATLGPDHRFATRVLATDEAADGVVTGDLVLVGGGDPVLSTPEYEAHLRDTPRHRLAPVTRLADLAERVAATGVRRVTGALVADDTRHDGLRFLPQWRADYFLDGDIGRLSALTVDDANASFPGEERVEEPALHAGAELVRLLAERGVAVDGGVRAGRAPSDAVELARVESVELDAIVAAMITASDNQTAELLLREVGAASGDGSTEAGAQAAATALGELGVSLDGARIVDGSGLARDNALACSTIVAVLDLRTRAGFGALDAGLAVAGRTGTLAGRLADPAIADRLRAKTGYLNGVSGLAGVVDGPAPLEFATLVAGEFAEDGARDVQASVAGVLARFPDVADGLVPAP